MSIVEISHTSSLVDKLVRILVSIGFFVVVNSHMAPGVATRCNHQQHPLHHVSIPMREYRHRCMSVRKVTWADTEAKTLGSWRVSNESGILRGRRWDEVM